MSMLELYHSVNSVCAQRVRLALAEKNLEWKSHIMTLRGDQFDPTYMKLNPNAVVPTLLHDGNAVIESTVILHYLDEVFPDPPLMPAAPADRAKVRMFTKLLDEYVHNSCTVLTFATAFRAPLARMSRDALEAELAKAPNQKRSAFKRDVVAHGLDSSYALDAVQHHDKLLDWIVTAMERGPYLAGDRYSIADAAVTPYVLRLDLLRLAPMWAKRPGVAAWYERVRQRPSFDRAIARLMTDVDRAPFASFEPDPWPKVQDILRAA
jgi:glutathione S-transferase